MLQLRETLDRRLDAVLVARAELDRALQLQRTLLRRQIDLLEAIRDGGLPKLALPTGYLTAKLKRGVPILHGEPIPLPSNVLQLMAREFCDHLAEGGAGTAASLVGRAFDSHTIDSAAAISACFGRDERRVRFMATQHGLSPDIVWLVSELAVAPFAHLLQRRVFDGDVARVPNRLREWDRGFCPACGSWPAIIEGLAAGHVLRCSFCAAGWELSSYRCLYCGNDQDSFVTAAPNPEQPGRRVQLCGACGGYEKVIELSEPTEFPLVAIEDLASMDLDMLAIERKYMRPRLPEIKHRN
jgi:FdhE protein